jgi:cyclophilin family peptidyl-prolyl cis-trans isomerase
MKLRFLLVALMSIASSQAAKAANPVVVMETSMGTIKIELFEDKSPITVKNFLAYVDDKHYDNTIFHRVMSTFMIQGGGYKPGMASAVTRDEVKKLEKPTKEAIKNESNNGVLNERGTLAMARLPGPDTATAQFFINVKNNPNLDAKSNKPGYAVFGRVIDGMDIVDKIKNVKTKAVIPGEIEDVPVDEVIIKSVRRADK